MSHDEDKLRDAIQRLTNGTWRAGRKDRGEPSFSIPANWDRDADLILGAAITELLKLRALRKAVRRLQHARGTRGRSDRKAAIADLFAALEACK